MGEYNKASGVGKRLLAGVDVEPRSWHVTVRTEDQELFRGVSLGHGLR